MADTIDEIQREYVHALRAIAPEVRAWWAAMVAREGEDPVWFRWPTGMAGHPRVIAIFREYYFRIESLNRKKAFDEREEVPDSEDMWGKDDLGTAPQFHRHVDRLVFDLPTIAADVADLVDGMVLVPVGVDAAEQPV